MNPFVVPKPIRDEVMMWVDHVLRSGFYSKGDMTQALESLMSTTEGRKVLLVSSGTAALDLAFRWLAQSGKKSITIPEMTVPMVYRAANAHFDEVVLADVDLHDFSLTGDINTEVACLVTTGGISSGRIAELAGVLKSNGVTVVEDASHSHGCTFGCSPSLTLGDISIQSWYATKVLTMGEGGLIASGDVNFMDWAEQYANQGKDGHSKQYSSVGTNYRPSEMAVLLGHAEWKFREYTYAVRRQWAGTYMRHGMPYVGGATALSHSTFFKYPVMVKNQEEVLQALARNGIPAAGPVHHAEYENEAGGFAPYANTNCRFIDEHQVCLPVAREFNRSMAYAVIQTMREVAEWIE